MKHAVKTLHGVKGMNRIKARWDLFLVLYT